MEALIVEFVVRTALIATAAALVLWILRIRTAAAQHAIWTGVLGLMLALPVLILWAPKVAVQVLPSTTGGYVPRETAPYAPSSSAPATQAVEEEWAADSAPAWNWNMLWLGAYAIGASVLLLRLAIGTLRANGLNSAVCAVPVTVGLFRPRVILPEGWEQWAPAQLDAVMTHERAHARRHDPLVQWIGLFNRALFWFHPLAWWLERHLSALAEEACDAAVLQQGHEPTAYSQFLLELARAVQRSGVRVNLTGMAMPGSHLPQRIRKIIGGLGADRVSPPKMAGAVIASAICSAMFAAGTLEQMPQVQLLRLTPPEVRALDPEWNSTPAREVKTTAPVLLAQTQLIPPQPRKPLTFDVASVKPATVPEGVTVFGDGKRLMPKGARIQIPRNTGGPGTADPGRIRFPLITMKELLKRAYGDVHEIRGPGWIDSQVFAIEATMPAETTEQQFEEMLRNLIAERFQLKYHVESKEVMSYVLTVAKNGPKMKESANQNEPVSDQRPRAIKGPDGVMALAPRPGPWNVLTSTPGGSARMINQQQTMQDLAQRLGNMLDAIVTDGTGLTARYDFTVAFAGRAGPGGALPPSSPVSQPEGEEPLPDIFSALSEQLGLKLEHKRVSVKEMFLDHVEKTPISNSAVIMSAPATRILSAQSTAEKSERFEVASIRTSDAKLGRPSFASDPGGGIRATNVTLKLLIQMAYDVRPEQLSGGPGWTDLEEYTVIARGPEGTAVHAGSRQQEQTRKCLQTLLSERFHLALKHETNPAAGYVLTVDKKGAKMTVDDDPGSPQLRQVGRWEIRAEGIGMSLLAHFLGVHLRATVVDRTGLEGRYRFQLNWTPVPLPSSIASLDGLPEETLIPALQEQLGLRLERQNVATDRYILERVEKPTEN